MKFYSQLCNPIERKFKVFDLKNGTKSFCCWVVLIWLSVGVCIGSPLVGEDLIRWKFQAGDQYDVLLTQKTVLKTRVNRTDVRVEVDLGTEMSWKVQSIKPNGNAVIEQTFTRMNVKVAKTAKPTIRYDTASQDEPSANAKHFANVYDPLIGINFTVEMSDRGEIVGVMIDQEATEIIRKIPESMEARQLFEKKGLMKILNSGGFVLPEAAIDKGYQWPVNKTQKMSFGTAELESVFTFQGIDQETGLASFDQQATTKLTDQPKNPLELPLVVKSQKQTGALKFQARDGYLQSVKNTQEMVTEKPFREMTVDTQSQVEFSLSIKKK